MGYPMAWDRVMNRNRLRGGYENKEHSLIAGDLERLENDTQDALHIALYAKLAGVPEKKVRAIFAAFFSRSYQEGAWSAYNSLGEDKIHRLQDAVKKARG